MALVLYLLTMILSTLVIHPTFLADAGGTIGVNYGLVADNLPSPAQAINLLKSRNIGQIRIFEPNHDVLSALQNSRIKVIIGTTNADIANIANDMSYATNWVQTNVIPFAPTVNIRAISIGNEANAGDISSYMLQALKNLDAAVKATGYLIPITTTISMNLITNSYPPSSGDFTGESKSGMQQIAGFLSGNGYPLMVTVYPYFAYASDPTHISSSYALFTSNDVVRDGSLEYRNLFDAMVDAANAALEKVGGGSVQVIVAETGWPSKGNGDYTTANLAQTYNQNLVKHVYNSGTPRKPGTNIEAYIFALFNEDQKSGQVDQNFGLYYPDMTEVYHINF